MSSLLVQHQADFSQAEVNVPEREREVNLGLIDIWLDTWKFYNRGWVIHVETEQEWP